MSLVRAGPLALPYARPGTFRKKAVNITTGAPHDLGNRLAAAILKQDVSDLHCGRV